MKDGGEGKPPKEYLWAVEQGLRNLGRLSVSLYLNNCFREHAMLAKTAGVKHVIVLINKMDDPTVEWEEAR